MKTQREVPAILFLTALLTALPAAAQTATPQVTLEDFAWLAGRWEGNLPSGEKLEQVWSEPVAGHMLGMFRLLQNDKVVLLEIFSLYETPEGLEFYVRHFDPALVPGEKGDATLLRLTQYDGERGVFENPVHNRPKTTALIRTGPHTFTARSEIIRDDGAVQVIEAFWQRLEPGQRGIHQQVTVPAPLEEVWRAWTTTEGVTSFFGPAAHIEATVGGPYEVYFSTEAPYGSRGSEGCRVLSVVPMNQISFQWNAPPSMGVIRDLHTRVTVRLHEETPDLTRVEIIHTGWGAGEQWDKAYDYFDKAWDAVLGNLHYRFTVGPVDFPGHFIRAGQAQAQEEQ